MDIATVIAVGRVIERLLIVFVAGLALWFGFKLFQITANDTSSGEITYQHLRLRLTKVAPGIFFALFGCGLLGYSIVSVAVVPIEAANTNSTPRPSALYVFEPNPSSGVPPALASLNTIHQIAVQFRSGGELTNETRVTAHRVGQE